MYKKKIETIDSKINSDNYDYYIAIDWSQRNMAVATMKKDSNKIRIIDVESDLGALKTYFKSLSGSKILTIEETTPTHYLYVELFDYVDRILICDPYKNKLLSDGPKTDKIDAGKLCMLLKGGFLREVYHSINKKYELRQYVSEYEQLVKFGVSVKNQKSAIYRSMGKSYQKKEEIDDAASKFIIEKKDQRIELYESQKKDYEKMFANLIKLDKGLKHLRGINGIGIIGAVKILATVIDANRFENAGKYLSYCGLVKHQKMSGGRNYGQKNPRYNRRLKSVYKTAAMSVIGGKSSLSEYYNSLLKQGISEDKARHRLARRIAIISFGVMKSGMPYDPYKWRNTVEKENKD